MDYIQLIEMPRFYIAYSIKFFNEKNKEKTLSYFNNHKINDDVMVEVLYEEEETYSLNLRFSLKYRKRVHAEHFLLRVRFCLLLHFL